MCKGLKSPTQACPKDNKMYVTADKTVLCLEEGDPVERTNTRCNELAQSFLKSEWSERVRDELAPYMEAFQNVDNVA